MDQSIRKHFIFYGSVQGVGFRYRAFYQASRLGLSGWVRNLYDGTVEMEVEGKEEDIQALVWFLDQSKPIRIEGIDSEDLPLNGREKGFRMLN